MKRWYGWFILVIYMLFWSGFAQAQQTWVANPMIKLLQSTPRPSPFDSSATLYAAKNEFESFQIGIRHTASVTVSDITVSDLTDGVGHTISATNNIMIYREGYLNITTSSTIEAVTYPNGGVVPDALIPKVDDYFREPRTAFPHTIPANTTQAFWIEVYVPADAVAGTYSGTVTISSTPTIPPIPISLTVWNFQLPSTASLKSAYAAGRAPLRHGHDGGFTTDARSIDLTKIYSLALLRHRISNESITYGSPGYSDWSAFDRDWGPFLNGSGNLTIMGTTFNMGTEKLPGAKLTTIRLMDWCCVGDRGYYQRYANHFNSDHPDWFNSPSGGIRLFAYVCDEPPRGCSWSSIPSEAAPLHSTTPPHKVMVTTSIQRARQNGVAGSIDLFTPTIRWLEDKPVSQGGNSLYQGNQRSQYGSEVWWYQACGSHGCNMLGGGPDDTIGYHTGWPSYMADLPNIYSRIFQWHAYKYNIQGELYFETVYAYKEFERGSCSGGANPWKTVYCFGGNGDGTLFYPGTTVLRPGASSTYAIGGTHDIPIESIRLKLIRDGMEDYEYLRQTENKNGKTWVETNVLPKVADPTSGTFLTYKWNKDPGTPTSANGLLAARQQMGVLLGGSQDFTLTANPSQATLARGGGTSSTITVQSISGFNSAVALTCTPPQPTTIIGITCSLNPASVTPPVNGSATSTLTVNTSSSTPAGTYGITITGTSGSLVHQISFTLIVTDADFTFDPPPSPPSATVAPGAGASSTITVTSINNFNSAVALTCSVAPIEPTIGCSLNPTSVTPPANGSVTSALSVTTTTGTPAGTYTVTVTGTSGSLSRQTSFSLTVSPDFAMKLEPPSATVPPGGSATSTLTVQSLNNFSAAVSLTCSTPDLSIGCSLNPTSVTPPSGGSATSTLSVTTQAATPAGNYSIVVTGTSGNINHQIQFTLIIQPITSDFSLSASPTSATVTAGNTASSTITVTSGGGFNSAVTLSCSTSYPSVGCSLNPASVTPPPNGSVTSTLSVTTQTTTSLAPYTVVVTGTSGGLSHLLSFTPIVQSSDTFDRADSTSLGSNWNEYLTNLEIFSNQVRNTDAGSKAAQFTQSIGPDQDVSVDCKMTASGNNCAVIARWTDANNYYYARLDVGAGNIKLFKVVAGGAATQVGSTATRTLSFNQYYRVRLVAKGSTLTIYFANEATPAISVTDTSLITGNYVGIRSFASAAFTTWFDNFSVTVPFSDIFDRPDNTSLGSGWNEYLPDLEISAGQIRNFDGNNKTRAAIFNQSIGPDQDVSVDCKVTASGNACGVMARWKDENNFYRVRLDAGQGNIVLFKTVNGTTTQLGSPATRTLNFNQYYRIRLVIQGSSLSVYFANEGTAAISVTDTSLAAGDYAGIRSFVTSANTAWFDNFNALPSSTGSSSAVLFNDDFNRTTGMGSSWNVFYGSFSTDGTYAVSGTPPINGNWAAMTQSLNTNDYTVESVLIIPAGSLYSGIFARSSNATYLDSDLYAAQIATDGTVNLYRRNGWTWTQLQSVASGITAGTPYTLKLVVTGSNPVNLQVYLNAVLKINYQDSSANRILSGTAGIQNYDPNVKYDYFTVSVPVNPSATIPFSDDFNRTGADLGPNWKIYYAGFSTDGAQAVSSGTAGIGKWAGVIPSVGTNDYAVESVLTVPAASHYSGIIVRGDPTDISTSGYAAQLDTAGTVNLYRRSPGGVWTLLQSAPAPGGIAAGTPYKLKLVVTGSTPVNLEVDFQGSLLFTYADSAANRVLSGIPGIQNYDPNVKYDYFTVSIAPPANNALFSDNFNRTTGLGANWNMFYGSFSTDGAYAVSTGSQNWAGITPSLGTNDYAVESVLVVPPSSAYSGIVARGDTATLYSTNYVAQISTGGTINLYRRNAGVWTLLQSATAPGGIVAGIPYKLKLVVTGSNPVNLKVDFQGSLLFTYADSDANRILSGIPGMQNYNPNVKYGYFTVLTP